MNHNFLTINRPATMKTMLQKYFGETTGLHNRVHKSKSTTVYDVSFIYRVFSKFLRDIKR